MPSIVRIEGLRLGLWSQLGFATNDNDQAAGALLNCFNCGGGVGARWVHMDFCGGTHIDLGSVVESRSMKHYVCYSVKSFCLHWR